MPLQILLGMVLQQTQKHVASSFASSSNATNILSNTVMYSYLKLHYSSSHDLSLAVFLSYNGVY